MTERPALPLIEEELQPTKKVTRDIDPALAQDLLERAPRVCLAFAGADGPRVYPVKLAFKAGRCQVYLPALKMDALPPEAVLLVDEGVYYFDLRAIYLRGALEPAGEGWFELVPTRTVAWDYGLLRWVEGSTLGGGSDGPG